MTTPEHKRLRWLWCFVTRQCPAVSPEGLSCAHVYGHDGLHIPNEGSGWAWG
jgi:hypothetical protein